MDHVITYTEEELKNAPLLRILRRVPRADQDPYRDEEPIVVAPSHMDADVLAA
jgi:hypothetical protein